MNHPFIAKHMSCRFHRIVCVILAPALIFADPALSSGFANAIQPHQPSQFDSFSIGEIHTQAITPPPDVAYTGTHAAITYRQEGGRVVRAVAGGERTRRWFLAATIGAATSIALNPIKMLAQATKQIVPSVSLPPDKIATEASVPNAENTPHIWQQEPVPAGPIRAVEDVIEFVLRRDLRLALDWEKLQKARREARLPLFPRSTFGIHNDLNHTGPEFATGTTPFQAGIRDLVLYPLRHTENSPNRIDSASGKPSLTDLFRGGIEIHSRGQQAVFEAQSLYQLAVFKAKVPELLAEPAEKYVNEAVEKFFHIADLDIQIYYKGLETANLERAIAFYEENKRAGADQSQYINAKARRSNLTTELVALKTDRLKTQFEFFRHSSAKDQETLLKAGGIQPRWPTGAIEHAPLMPILSNDIFLTHLEGYYKLRPSSELPVQLASARTGGNDRWENVAAQLEQKGMKKIADRLRRLAPLSAQGLNLADPRVRDLYLQIRFPVAADNIAVPAPLHPSFSEMSILGPFASVPTSGPAPTAKQLALTFSDDADTALAQLYTADEHNLTQWDISVFGLLATIFNARVEPALTAKIATKEEKIALHELMQINQQDRGIIHSELQIDQGNEKTDWTNRQLAISGAQTEAATQWESITTQSQELLKQFALRAEAGPDLSDPIFNAQNSSLQIEQANLKIVQARGQLALQSNLRILIFNRLAGIADQADAAEQPTPQPEEKPSPSPQSAKRKGSGFKPGFLKGIILLPRLPGVGHSIHGVYVHLAQWFIYNQSATAVLMAVLTLAIPYVWTRWFKEIHWGMPLAYSALGAFIFFHFLSLPLLLALPIAASLAAFSQLLMSSREYKDSSIRQKTVNTFTMARRAAITACGLAVAGFGLQAIGRRVLPYVQRQELQIHDAQKNLTASAGLVGEKEEENPVMYAPPKGASGSVVRVRWPKNGIIHKNQPIVFWKIPDSFRQPHNKPGSSTLQTLEKLDPEFGALFEEAPEDAVLVIQSEGSSVEQRLLKLVNDYNATLTELRSQESQAKGVDEKASQVAFYEAKIEGLRAQASACLEEWNQLTWRASGDIKFDPKMTKVPDGKVGTLPIPLFLKPYMRLHFTFYPDEAYLFTKYWADPTVSIQVAGRRIPLKNIVGIERDTTTRPLQSPMVSDLQIKFFADLRSDADNPLVLEADQQVTFEGFFRGAEKITETIPQGAYIGFISPMNPSPVAVQNDLFQQVLEKEAKTLESTASVLDHILDASNQRGSGWGMGGMNNGTVATLQEMNGLQSQPDDYGTLATQLRTEATDLSTNGVDLTKFAGHVVVKENGKTFYADSGPWLHYPFDSNLNDLIHNTAYPPWYTLPDGNPLMTVDFSLPAAGALDPGNVYQVLLVSHDFNIAANAKEVTRADQDANIPQHPQQLQVQFNRGDYFNHFPPEASPAVGIVVVQKVSVRAAVTDRLKDRRSFLSVWNWGNAAAMSAVIAIGGFAADRSVVPQSNAFIQIVATLFEIGTLVLLFDLVRHLWHLFLDRLTSLDYWVWLHRLNYSGWLTPLDYKVPYQPTGSPSARNFEEAERPAEDRPKESLAEGQVPAPESSVAKASILSKDQLTQLSDDFKHLLPDEVRVSWQMGWDWWANDSLTIGQRVFGWPLGLLRFKNTFVVRRDRLLYTSYKSANVGLWQSWVIYHKNMHFKRKDTVQGRILSYLWMLGIFAASFFVLFVVVPLLIAQLPFALKQSIPQVPFLQGIRSTQADIYISVIIDLVVTAFAWGAIFKPLGEGVPIYWWAGKAVAFIGLGKFMETNFYQKTDQNAKEALEYIDALALPNDDVPRAIKELDGVARELRLGLAQTFAKSSRDVRENVSENFYEFDRDLRFGQFRSQLEGLRLDFKPDALPDKLNPEVLIKQRRAHIQVVEKLLENDSHARGLLFAMIGADCTELALAGLSRKRAEMLRPFLELLTKRTRSLVFGLNELHGKNARDHQLFQWIHFVFKKIRGPETSQTELDLLKSQFRYLANGEETLQQFVDILFANRLPPSGLPLRDLERRTIVYLFVRRWAKTDPAGLRKTMTETLQQYAPEKMGATDFWNDEFLRGDEGKAMTTAARLLMMQRHEEELEESLLVFGIRVFPAKNKRDTYYESAMFTNLQQAVRRLRNLAALIRGRAVAPSATETMDSFTTGMRERIPPRLTYDASRTIDPLYSKQLYRLVTPRNGRPAEPVVVFSYEGSSLQKFMRWNGTFRVISPAPQVGGLGFYLVANIIERAWLHAAFAAVSKKGLTATERERLEWTESNLFTIGDYLESNGIGWSVETKFTPGLLNRMPKIGDPLKGDLDFGRWDLMQIYTPSVVFPDSGEGYSSRESRMSSRFGRAA
jgi:hypothetical protein